MILLRMTKILVVAVVLFSVLLSGCTPTKVYILGIDVTEIVKEDDMGTVVLGAMASVAVHVAGHYVAAELVGADIYQQGTREIIANSGELNGSDRRWLARGGFVAQTLVGIALVNLESTRGAKFTEGYAIGTMLEIGFYPLRRRGEDDLEHLENNGGDGDLEWAIYTGLSAYGLYRTTDSSIRVER